MKLIVFSLMAVVLVLLPGHMDAQLQCYNCQGSGADCADPYPKTGDIRQCTQDEQFCEKTKTIKPKETIIVRRCATGCSPYDRKDDDGNRIINSCCATSECNAATGMSYSIIVMVTSLLLAILTRRQG